MTPISHPHAGGLRDMQTKTQLLGAFGLLCAVMAVVGVIGIWGMGQISARADTIANHSVPSMKALGNTRANIFKIGRDFRQVILEPDAQKTATDLAIVNTDEQQLKTDFAVYLALSHSANEQQAIVTFQGALNDWLATLHATEPLAAQNTADGNAKIKATIDSTLLPQSVTLGQTIDSLTSSAQQRADATQADASSTYTRMMWLLIACVMVAVVAAIDLGYWMANRFAQPLRQMVGIAQQVADGEMPTIDDFVTQNNGRSEIGQLTLAFQAMLANLRELVNATSHLSDGELIHLDEIEARYATDAQKGILAKSLNKIIHRQQEYAQIMQRVGDGDLTRIEHMMARYE